MDSASFFSVSQSHMGCREEDLPRYGAAENINYEQYDQDGLCPSDVYFTEQILVMFLSWLMKITSIWAAISYEIVTVNFE